MINGQSAGIDGDQWAKVANVPGLRCDPPRVQGKEGHKGCLILAHGAGAPMDSGFMDDMAQRLAALGVACALRVPYMAERGLPAASGRPTRRRCCWNAGARCTGRCDLWSRALAVGGKSMGGRMASLLADELGADALVCLGYPFYAVGKPEKPRVEHLAGLKTPTLIVQGERDALGNRRRWRGMRCRRRSR
jgi:predicted alpha/beta-hydrolase family hydrolase